MALLALSTNILLYSIWITCSTRVYQLCRLCTHVHKTQSKIYNYFCGIVLELYSPRAHSILSLPCITIIIICHLMFKCICVGCELCARRAARQKPNQLYIPIHILQYAYCNVLFMQHNMKHTHIKYITSALNITIYQS